MDLVVYLKDVEPDGMPNGMRLTSRDFEDEECLEAPIKEACKLLYDLNIRTTFSSANKQDVTRRNGYGWINIDYDSLSPENQAIADQYFGHEKQSVGFEGQYIRTAQIFYDNEEHFLKSTTLLAGQRTTQR